MCAPRSGEYQLQQKRVATVTPWRQCPHPPSRCAGCRLSPLWPTAFWWGCVVLGSPPIHFSASLPADSSVFSSPSPRYDALMPPPQPSPPNGGCLSSAHGQRRELPSFFLFLLPRPRTRTAPVRCACPRLDQRSAVVTCASHAPSRCRCSACSPGWCCGCGP